MLARGYPVSWSLAFGSGEIGITGVKCVEEELSMNVLRGYPGRFFIRAFVAGPTDEVTKVAGPEATVVCGAEDLGDLVLFFVVRVVRFELDGSRRWLNAVRNRVRNCGLELRDVEDRVNARELFRKTDGIRMSTRTGEDLVGSEETFGEFLDRSARLDPLRINEDLRADRQFGCRKSMLVGLDLVALLGVSEVLSEVGVELVKINGELQCMVARDGAFRKDG